MKSIIKYVKKVADVVRQRFPSVYFGRSTTQVPEGSIVFFPYCENLLCCGIAGIVSVKAKKSKDSISVDISDPAKLIKKIEEAGYSSCTNQNLAIDNKHYLAGKTVVEQLLKSARALKSREPFFRIFKDKEIQTQLSGLAGNLHKIIDTESKILADQMGHLSTEQSDTMLNQIEKLQDTAWCIKSELLDNVNKTGDFFNDNQVSPTLNTVDILKNINSVLNSIDRLEVRGRDSAGISLLFTIEAKEYKDFYNAVEKASLKSELDDRLNKAVLLNKGISINKTESGDFSIAIIYKIAAAIGSLGDNVAFLRKQIQTDQILHRLLNFNHVFYTISSHTRWASMGAITESNCHPVDNKTKTDSKDEEPIIHVSLNGDIDNFQELKAEYESSGNLIPKDITTDTKIIPLRIHTYVKQGNSIEEAFRLAVNDFKGSHAISMHTNLAPGKLFLAQKGSGQAVFVGLAHDHYMPASEVYGFVEQTSSYIKIDGEKIFQSKNKETQGQIFILNQKTAGQLDGISAMFYDGTPVELSESDIKHTEITSRDIDRRHFPHYFLKEISESPDSVRKTLANRWKIKDGKNKYSLMLDESTFPKALSNALIENRIKRIFFVGQGTAGVAALACANIVEFYLNDPSIYISALKASELSGFKISSQDSENAMSDTLVVAISQSGTTTDTNRTVDMVRQRGAYTLAIVNRRDSDITFKVQGVMYTSSGRDIEMSVASTKAFYSQIVAGALLGLHIARLKNSRKDQFVADEISRLLKLPDQMRKVLDIKEQIKTSAQKFAPSKTYWAAVGSGLNKASSDEIRIKMSELCYKTISSDYIEDKKHIDLSSEPVIIVCAAGTRETVIKDIIKDVAIFQAHKATPIVIADQGEHRFDPYAVGVFNVPIVKEHLAPVLNTLVGHLWGYYAALAINNGSRFFYQFRQDLQDTINDYVDKKIDIFELTLEKSFRTKIMEFYKEFKQMQQENSLSNMGLKTGLDITLLLKYLTGSLSLLDFEADFGKKGTAKNMLDTLFESISDAIDSMSRPVDAIKHQAKTVTVGTSRISDKVQGILFDIFAEYNFEISQLTTQNIIVLKNLQGIVSQVKGSLLYRIDGLDILGDPTEEATIRLLEKRGLLKSIPSRVDTDIRLKGTKRIIVKEKNVYVGMGRRDNRSIIIIPIISSEDGPSHIGNLLLLNIGFKENISLNVKIKALGRKYEKIKDFVQESIEFEDKYLELIETKELFGLPAAAISKSIVSIVH